MHYLTYWQGALALALVPVLHWAVLGRTLAVSGRFSALVDRLRHGTPATDVGRPMTEVELLAAIRAETVASFGSEAIEEAPASGTVTTAIARPPDSPSMHVWFLAGLMLGGLASAMIAGSFAPTPSIRGELFATFTGGSLAARMLTPLLGGLLVGVGTRMAGGCTSGHGLCGLSQFQPGSLVATMAFFAIGVVVSFVIGALS